MLRAILQLVLSLVVLAGAVAAVGYLLRDELNALGGAFVKHFGIAGMFVGTFIADAFSFPIPPQFYMLTAITAGSSQVGAMAAICVASLLAGQTGYHLAGRIARVEFICRRIDLFRPKIDRLFERYGYWAIAVGSLTPIPFSVLCYLSGLYRIPPKLFTVLLLFRVPRLILFYALIRLGWAQGA
ncbi:YqaA family protein [Chondromyces crocatus]|uniref:YqaA family protein n=1 Tax=Chondromyces crocatus TaxID=52 RepID=UPI00067D445E|nr:VTT domain-containing protein [Chondromyces crocatus]